MPCLILTVAITDRSNPTPELTRSSGSAKSEPPNTKRESILSKRGIINPLFGMTDAAFFGKIRADLRKRWMYSEAYKQALKRAKVSCKDGRRKYAIKCFSCGNLHNLNERVKVKTKKGTLKSVLAYQVDHTVECGTLKSFADLSLFAERLFTGTQEVLCYHCHQKKHHGESAE